MRAENTYGPRDYHVCTNVKKLEEQRILYASIIVYLQIVQIYITFSEVILVITSQSLKVHLTFLSLLVDMFLSCMDTVVKESIISMFTQDSCLRVVVATVAFGIDCPEVRQVIHIGAPSDIESYVQETGCGGRDGAQTLALLLSKNTLKPFTQYMYMKEHIDNHSMCHRDFLFTKFDSYSRDLLEYSFQVSHTTYGLPSIVEF